MAFDMVQNGAKYIKMGSRHCKNEIKSVFLHHES
jgi:hypothetical protein